MVTLCLISVARFVHICRSKKIKDLSLPGLTTPTWPSFIKPCFQIVENTSCKLWKFQPNSYTSTISKVTLRGLQSTPLNFEQKYAKNVRITRWFEFSGVRILCESTFFLDFMSRGSVWIQWVVHLTRVYIKWCRLYLYIACSGHPQRSVSHNLQCHLKIFHQIYTFCPNKREYHK